MNFPALLLILDGWGIAPPGPGNTLSLAKLPTFDRLDKEAIKVTLDAASTPVGLPEGHQGSSEMGHLMIGAGRPVVFPQTQVKNALQNNLVRENPVYREVIEYCKKNNKTLHLFGLLSDRGVHAYAELCFQLLRLANEIGVMQVAIHIIADGRDTTPKELPIFVHQLEQLIQELGLGEIASVIGRYYAMDRDQRFERTQKAIDLLVYGAATYHAADALTGLNMAYARGETDEFVQPTQIKKVSIQADDLVIVMNFRSDRVR